MFYEVVRSAARKINLANHVPGLSYEAFDAFSSHKTMIPMEEATEERIRVEGDKLQARANDDVDRTCVNYVEALKKVVGMPTTLNAKDLEGIKHFIDSLNNVSTKGNLDKIENAIKEDKANLNEAQLEYLRSQTRKARARI